MRIPAFNPSQFTLPCFAVLAGLLLLGPNGTAQSLDRFEGQVVNGSSHLPVEQAIVTLDAIPPDGTPEFETFTGAFGFYKFDEVPFGSYELKAQHPAYIEHKENLNLTPETRRSKMISLFQATAKSVFDVDFQVYGLATQIVLPDAEVTAEYWLPDGTISGTPDRVFRTRTDQFGAANLSMLEDGFYRFQIKRSGWDDITYMPSADIGPIVGESVRLIRDHVAAVFMKPERFEFKAKVIGYDPVKEEENKPIVDAALQLTGYDFPFQRVVLPQVSRQSSEQGTYLFDDLIPINYKFSVAKLGYEIQDFDISQNPDGEFADINATLQLQPTKVKIKLDSPYGTTEAVEGAKILLKGILNSASAEINREMEATLDEDGETVSALFENLLPGRYWIHVVHKTAITGLPGESGPLRNPTQFNISFFPIETYVQVAPGVTEELDIMLNPVPATIRGRLYATDEVGRLDEELCFSEPNRVFHQRAHDDIQFIEHEVVDLLDDQHKVLSVSTDEAGNYTALVIPGIYGVKMPNLDGYSGHNIEFGNLSAGEGPHPRAWPYPDVWTYNNFEFGHHGGGLAFNSEHEYQLDFVVHKHYIHVSGLISIQGSPFGGVVLRIDPDGSNPEIHRYNHFEQTKGMVQLTGTSSQTVPINGDNRFLFRNLSPGNYTMAVVHPDYTSQEVSFTIAPWDAPGIIPRVEPFTPSYFFPGIVHCNFQFDIEASWKHKGQIEIKTYRFNANTAEYDPIGSRFPQYFRAAAFGNTLFKYDRVGSVPPGAYTIYSKIDDGWYRNSGTGSQTFDGAVIGGALDNTKPSSSPTNPGTGTTTVSGDLATYIMDLHAVSAGDTSMDISNVTVEFPKGTPKPAGGIVRHEGTAFPNGASHAGMQWTYSFFPSPTVELIDPLARSVKVTVFMKRAMVISGEVKIASNSINKKGLAGAAVVIRGRNGAPLNRTVTDKDGKYRVGNFDPQPIYVDINRRGFIPQRHLRKPGSQDNPDLTGQDFEMAPVPAPSVSTFKMNRFGLFIPGVTKSSDSSIPGTAAGGLNPESARGKLTATWKVKASAPQHQISLTGFYDAKNKQKPNEVFTINDKIEEVWIVDRRAFDKPFVNDPNQLVTDNLRPPSTINYVTVRQWLSEMTSAKKDNQPHYVVHKIAMRQSINDDGEFEGKIPLWELPSGVFKPRAVVITKSGGVLIEDYKLPKVGDKDAMPLQGMTLPKWAASLLEVVGTVSNLATVGDASNVSEDDLKARQEKVNKNYGNRFLKMGKQGKVEARIGLVPIDSSTNSVDRVVFFPSGNLLSKDLYLTYKYVLGVDLPIGEDSPPSGVLGLISKKTGINITGVEAEFEVAGAENKACVAIVLPVERAEGEKKEEELETKKSATPSLAKRASDLLGVNVSFKGPSSDYSVKFAACETFGADNFGNSRISAYSGVLEAQAKVDAGVAIEITPVIKFVPYGAIVDKLNKTVKEKFDLEAIRLDAFFEGTLGGKVTYEVTGEFPSEKRIGMTQVRPRGEETPAYNFMGMSAAAKPAKPVDSNGVKVKQDLQIKFIVRAAVGLKLSVAGGAISGSGKIQIGAPKGSSDTDGVFLTIDPLMKKHLVTKYEGALSFVLNARLNLYVTSLSKKWQYDFLTFSVERGSVPRFDLTPMNTSTLIISPFTAQPSTFVGQNGTLIDDFYSSGSIDVSNGDTPLTVYTGTDPITGEMTIMASLSNNGAWGLPIEVARSSGVISVAGQQLSDGRFVIAWSEISDTDMMNPYPSTSIKYSISDVSGKQWSPTQEVTSSDEAIFDLRLTGTTDNILLTYLSTPDGPLAANKSLWTSTFFEDQWSSPTMLLDPQSILEYELSGQGDSACLLATTTLEHGIQELHWGQGSWSEPNLVVRDADFPLDIAYDDNGDLLLFWKGLNGDLNASRRSSLTGMWQHTIGIVTQSNASSLQIQPLSLEGEDVLLLAYNQGTERTDLWVAWTDANGVVISEPRPLTFDQEGSFHELQIRPIATNMASLVALHSVTDQTTVKEVPIAFPTGDDCDADGLDDFVAIAAGLVTDCNENGIPDSCDILFADSTDFNRNLIPDECELVGSPDCDGNGIVDRDEIALGILEDANNNGIPDQCEDSLPSPSNVRIIPVSSMDFERYFRAENLSILANDPSTLIIEFEGTLEESTSTSGPWTLVE